jgi:hypothetical protein
LLRLACPGCCGRLPAQAGWPSRFDCPSCGSPLAVVSDDEPARRLVAPRIDEATARARALAAFRHPLAPPGFPGRVAEALLVWVACHEVERELLAAPHLPVVETLERGIAARASLPGLARLPVDAILQGEVRRPFDPEALMDGSIVLGAVRRPKDALPLPAGLTLLEERVELVFVPVWLVRLRHRGLLHEATVDAVGGGLLEARAPVARSARLGQAVALLYPLALLLGLPGRIWARLLVDVLLRLHPAVTFFLFIGLVWLGSWAWDRVRFRYEWVLEGTQGRLEPINRPDRTLPERVALFLWGLPFRRTLARRL